MSEGNGHVVASVLIDRGGDGRGAGARLVAQPDSMNRNAKERGQIRAMGQGRALQLLYRQAADQDLPERAR